MSGAIPAAFLLRWCYEIRYCCYRRPKLSADGGGVAAGHYGKILKDWDLLREYGLA